jgi:ATP-dependent RNA helicase DHX8/PRP22
MESRKLQLRVIKGFGGVALKRFCGKSNSSLIALVSRMRAIYMDERIGIEINVGDNEIQLFASSKDIEKIYEYVNNALRYETKWLRNECLEKCLYHEVRAGASPPVALVGAGAEIKHLELGNRCLTVDVHLSNVNVVDDKEVLTFLEKSVSGICGYNKFTGIGQHGGDAERWGRVSFLTPEAARKALYFNGSELCGCVLKLSLSRSSVGGIRKSSFAAVKAKISWPRRYSKGYAIVRCERNDAQFIVDDCFNVLIGGRFVQCQTSTRDMNSVVIRGLDKETSEAEILEVLHKTTNRRILDVFLIRGDEANNHSVDAFEQAILKEIAPFMPSQGPLSNYCHVQVFAPEPKDSFMKAWITFDGKLHLEAAKALQHMQGKALAGCFSWQKMQCQQVFHSSASCSASVYAFIERQLNILLKSFKFRPGNSPHSEGVCGELFFFFD